MMIVQLSEYTKTHWILHFNLENIMLCKLCLRIYLKSSFINWWKKRRAMPIAEERVQDQRISQVWGFKASLKPRMI